MKRNLLRTMVIFFCLPFLQRCSQGGGSQVLSTVVNDVNGAAGATSLACQAFGVPTNMFQAIAYAIYGAISGAAASGSGSSNRELYDWPGVYNDTVDLKRLEEIARDVNNPYDIAGRIHNKILNDFYKIRTHLGRPEEFLNDSETRNFIFDYIMNDSINSNYGYDEENREENLEKLYFFLEEGLLYQNDNLSSVEQFESRFNGIMNRHASSSCRYANLRSGMVVVRDQLLQSYESNFSLSILLCETIAEVQKINNDEYDLDDNNKAAALILISILRHSAVYWDDVKN